MPEWLTKEYERRKQEEYERIRAKHPDLVTTGFSCWLGWLPILERFFDEVAAALADADGVRFELWQVKEKFAGLRVYYVAHLPKPHVILDTRAVRADDARRKIDEAYERASKEAARTCEVCGKPGVLRQASGVFMTRCDEHADGGEPVRRDPDA
jgi:hypothetical protein